MIMLTSFTSLNNNASCKSRANGYSHYMKSVVSKWIKITSCKRGLISQHTLLYAQSRSIAGREIGDNVGSDYSISFSHWRRLPGYGDMGGIDSHLCEHLRCCSWSCKVCKNKNNLFGGNLCQCLHIAYY